MFLLLLTACLLQLSLSCPSNCRFCSTDSRCLSCGEGHKLMLSGGCTPQTVDNCRIYSAAATCSICEPTFKLVDRNCVKDYSGCIVRNRQGKCVSCWYGTRL